MLLASVSPYNFSPPIYNEFTFGSDVLVTNFPMVFAGSGVTFTSSGISAFQMNFTIPDMTTLTGQEIDFPMTMAG